LAKGWAATLAVTELIHLRKAKVAAMEIETEKSLRSDRRL